MPADLKTSALVTVFLENGSALEQALPLVLCFAAVGRPPAIYCEATDTGLITLAEEQFEQLQQLAEFGVSEIFANEPAALFFSQHGSSLVVSHKNPQSVRALHAQAGVIYAF